MYTTRGNKPDNTMMSFLVMVSFKGKVTHRDDIHEENQWTFINLSAFGRGDGWCDRQHILINLTEPYNVSEEYGRYFT